MTTPLKSYPEMKDSGVPWLGKMPSTWNIARNGGLFTQRNETGFAQLPILEVSLKTGVRVRNLEGGGRKQMMFDRDMYKRARKGDLAYNMMRMWQGAIGMAPTDGLVSPAYVVARPLCGVDPRFFLYLFRTDAYMGEVEKFSHGIVKDRNRLYWEGFKQMFSPVPPPDEQVAIVRFLDYADRRIKRHILAKQKLIKLMEEQKQAIIHRAVTRGLDPDVCLKPSGIEWLGDVPEHWEVLPLRRRWTVTDCKHLTVPFISEGISLASVREAQSFDLVLTSAKRTTTEWYEKLIEGDRAPRRGDLIYCRNVSVGACSFVNTDEQFAMGQDVCLIRSVNQNQRYLNYFLHSPVMGRQLAALLVGSTFDRINVAEIKGLVIVVPPREEQDEISDYLDRVLRDVENTIGNARSEISLLREYRTRLIADVVTGKLDVREAAANLPDETDEFAPLNDVETLAEGYEETGDADFDAVTEEAEA